MYVVVYLCIMCKRTLYTSSGHDAGIHINTLLCAMFIHQQWARRNTIFLFHVDWNPTGYSIGLGMFGGIPTFQPQMIKIDFCHDFSSPISDVTWTAEAALQPESAGMGVQPFLWRMPTSPCLRTPGRST